MAGYPFVGIALKGLEPYAGKLARTVLRGRKLPGRGGGETSLVALLRLDRIICRSLIAYRISVPFNNSFNTTEIGWFVTAIFTLWSTSI